MNALITDPAIRVLVAAIPAIADATRVEPLAGGLTNINYRVETPHCIYLMRVSHPSAAVLGIDRHNEYQNGRLASLAGLAPAIVAFVPEKNVLIIKWIDGKTLHAPDLRMDRGLLKSVASTIKKLHSGPAFQGDFYFPAIRKKYLNEVLKKGYFIPEKYLELETHILELEKLIAKKPEPRVPCNNDLLAENFIVEGDKIWIIDYEYAGMNEPSFELGNLAAESGLDDTQIEDLCEAYWQNDISSKIERTQAWSLIARYGWVLWASIQDAVSPIDFDYRSWGMNKWNTVLEELKSPRFRFILDNLKKSLDE